MIFKKEELAELQELVEAVVRTGRKAAHTRNRIASLTTQLIEVDANHDHAKIALSRFIDKTQERGGPYDEL